jgi:hypothetical protein
MSLSQDLHAHFAELDRRDAFPGVVLVTEGTTTIYEGAFGLASRAWEVPSTLQTRFDTASITKLFTAAAVLQMIDELLGPGDGGLPAAVHPQTRELRAGSRLPVQQRRLHPAGTTDSCGRPGPAGCSRRGSPGSSNGRTPSTRPRRLAPAGKGSASSSSPTRTTGPGSSRRTA